MLLKALLGFGIAIWIVYKLVVRPLWAMVKPGGGFVQAHPGIYAQPGTKPVSPWAQHFDENGKPRKT